MLSAGDAVPWQSSGGGATDVGGGGPRHGEDFLNLRETRLGISASSKAERATKEKKKKALFFGMEGITRSLITKRNIIPSLVLIIFA